MLTVNGDQRYEEIINKSRFIGYVYVCTAEPEARARLATLHQEYPDASHIAWAFRILTPEGLAARFYDAAEPSGTAGKPILQLLDARDLVNVLAVVVRYFGGIKLGAGGLTRAYGNTTKKAVDLAGTQSYVEMVQLTLCVEYREVQQLEYRVRELHGRILSQEFAERVHNQIILPKAALPALEKFFNNR